MKLREWNARLHGLVVFRSLLDDPVVAKLVDLTDRMEAGAPGYGPVCDAVAQFEAALFEHTTNWGSYLSAAVLEAETVCVRQAASGTLAPALQTALDSELAFLQALCGLTLDGLLEAAEMLGARRFHSFLTIVVPAILPGLCNSALMCLSGLFGDFAIIKIIASSQFETAQSYLYRNRAQDTQELSAAVVILLLITLLINYLVHKRQDPADRVS